MGQNLSNWKHHHSSEKLGLKEKKKTYLKPGSGQVQPPSELGSLKISAKHAVSSKDWEEKSQQTSHQASCSSGRSPGSCREHFCPLSFSLISCPVPVTLEVSCSPQELAWRFCAGTTGDRNKLCTPWATHQPKAFCTLFSSEQSASRSRKLLWHQTQLLLLTWGGSQHPAAWEGSPEGTMWRERQESTRHPILHGTPALAVHILRACNSHSCTRAALHYTVFLCWEMIPLKSGLLPRSLWACFFPQGGHHPTSQLELRLTCHWNNIQAKVTCCSPLEMSVGTAFCTSLGSQPETLFPGAGCHLTDAIGDTM